MDGSGFSCKLAAVAGGATGSFSSFLGCPMIPAASNFFRSSFTLGVSATALAAAAGLGVGAGVGAGLTAGEGAMAACGGIMGVDGTDMTGAAAR